MKKTFRNISVSLCIMLLGCLFFSGCGSGDGSLSSESGSVSFTIAKRTSAHKPKPAKKTQKQ